MRYPRVNLLNKNELRYQGAVSGRFLIVSAISLPVLILLIVLGIVLLQNARVKSALGKSRDEWAALQPQYNAYKIESGDLTASRDMVKMFAGWNNVQLTFSELLADIQLAVPGDVQLHRLSVRSKPSATVYKKPEDMNLVYTLVLEGQSIGASAEQHVFGFQRSLLDSVQVASAFESLEPEYIRKRESEKGGAVRDFRLEGRAAEGGRL